MLNHTHIRPAIPNDQRAVAHLAVVNDMFAEDEMDDFTRAFHDATSGDLPDHQWFAARTTAGDSSADDGPVTGAAYLAPEPFSDRVWNLYFLAVEPDGHGRGTGTALIAHVEALLLSAGDEVAQVLIVETSSTDQYAAARAFYLARGFDEETRIREFYGPGDDKIVFWKRLTP